MKFLLKEEKLNFPLVLNFNRMKLSEYPNIKNTSVYVCLFNPVTKKYKLLIQKRAYNMKNGSGKLSICGGKLEKYDESLQYGALREMLEETQIVFTKDENENITIENIKNIEPFLIPFSINKNNMSFYLVIVSEIEPIINGPLKKKIKPFNRSDFEVDLSNQWGENYKHLNITNGHAFCSFDDVKTMIANDDFWDIQVININKLISLL
jgi:hypothetical protein